MIYDTMVKIRVIKDVDEKDAKRKVNAERSISEIVINDIANRIGGHENLEK